jgi:hypothetical protein
VAEVAASAAAAAAAHTAAAAVATAAAAAAAAAGETHAAWAVLPLHRQSCHLSSCYRTTSKQAGSCPGCRCLACRCKHCTAGVALAAAHCYCHYCCLPLARLAEQLLVVAPDCTLPLCGRICSHITASIAILLLDDAVTLNILTHRSTLVSEHQQFVQQEPHRTERR